MGNLFFFIKSVIMTFVLVLLLQVQVGGQTLEERAVHWARTSSLIQPLQGVANGATVFLRESWQALTGSIRTNFWDTVEKSTEPGRRSLGIELQRSQEYLTQKAQEAARKAQENVGQEDIDRAIESAKGWSKDYVPSHVSGESKRTERESSSGAAN